MPMSCVFAWIVLPWGAKRRAAIGISSPRRFLYVGTALLLAVGVGLPAVARAEAATAALEEGRPPLRVGLTGVYPPFNYIDPAGELVGFDVDVAEELCARIGRPCAFEVLQWDGILSALLAKRIDVVVGSMAITPERERQVRFTRPYYESGAQLFVRPGAAEVEAPGFRLGVTLGTTYGQVARERFPEAVIRTYKGDTAALQDLQTGRLDGIITDKLVGLHLEERYGAGMLLRGEPLFEELLAIPVHPDEEELLHALDAALAELRASNRYDELYARYFGSGGAVPEGEGAFTWAGSIRLLLLALWKTIEVSSAGILLGVVFDEPSAALDSETSEELADLLSRIATRTQIVVVSHDLPFIERCTARGIRLDAGRVVSRGALGEILPAAGA